MANLVNLGLGMISITRERVKEWVEQNRILERGAQEKVELQKLVKNQVQEALSKLNIPTKQEIRRLEERIESLEKKLNLE